MAAHTVLVCDSLHDDALDWLSRQEDLELINRPGISPEELADRIRDVEALIVRSRTKLDADMLDRALKLRAIGRAGTGLDNIDQGAAREAGIAVLNTPGANANAVAELTIGLMLALARQLPEMFGARQKPTALGRELAGRTLGIIGVGQIGQRVAHLARAFDMRPLGHDRDSSGSRDKPNPPVEFVPLEELLPASDLVTLHVPITPETEGLFGRHLLGQLRPDAGLVNTARGGLVDETAVREALETGALAGYAADFCESERLRDHPNAIITPHIGAQTVEAQRRAGLEIAQRVADVLRTSEPTAR